MARTSFSRTSWAILEMMWVQQMDMKGKDWESGRRTGSYLTSQNSVMHLRTYYSKDGGGCSQECVVEITGPSVAPEPCRQRTTPGAVEWHTALWSCPCC